MSLNANYCVQCLVNEVDFSLLWQSPIIYTYCVYIYINEMCIVNGKQTGRVYILLSFFPPGPLSCVHSSASLRRTICQLILNGPEDNSKRSPRADCWDCTFPLFPPVSPWKRDNGACWHGVISLKRWKARPTLTIASLVFHLFSAQTSALSWPSYSISLSISLQAVARRRR